MGREYIDMLGGFGLYSPGIRHPKIVEAVKAQLDRSPQYSQEMLDPLRGQLAKVIAKLTPGELQYGFFANSGTEAVDGAMKLAKLYTGRRGFISTTGGFHGKSLGALSLLGKFVYREPLLPLLGGVRHVPYGDADAVEQLLRIADSVGRQGRMVTVERSGRSTRSLSSTFIKPAMELPSKQTPSSMALGRSLASTAMFFWVPKISQKAKRTNLTLLSSTKSRIYCWVE